MKATIKDITPHEKMEISVRVYLEDSVGDVYPNAELRLFIPQKDYTLSQLKQATLDEARNFLEKCLNEEWDYKASDSVDPIVFPSSEEQD